MSTKIPERECRDCGLKTEDFELRENGGICDECADDRAEMEDDDPSWGAHELW